MVLISDSRLSTGFSLLSPSFCYSLGRWRHSVYSCSDLDPLIGPDLGDLSQRSLSLESRSWHVLDLPDFDNRVEL